MPSKSDFITWAIERYQSSGGSGVASFSASSVTASKVQIRNDEGDLLEEYDKDFAEYKMGSIAGDSAPNETPRVKPEQVANRSFDRTGDNKQEATPKGAKPNLPLALAGLVALIGVIAFAATKIGVNTTTSAPLDHNPLKHLQQSGFQITGNDGYKWFFDKEGVTCNTEETPSITTDPNQNGWYTKTGSYVSVYCQGFGFNEDQTGKRFHYSTKNILCQRTGHEYWESSDGNAPVSGTDGEYPTKTPVTTYRDPVTSNHVICQAGRHYNMF